MNFENLDIKINNIVKEAKSNVSNYIDLLYISCLSKINHNPTETNKIATKKIIENYLEKKRNYQRLELLDKTIYIKNFTCVYVCDKYVEIWNDIKNSKSLFIENSTLTSLPLSLDYFEQTY